MDIQSLISDLEREWDLEQGALGRLRTGILDVDGLNRLRETLSTIDFENGIWQNRRVISLLWYIPLFMHWQRDRFAGDDEEIQFLDRITNEITAILEKLLGIP